MKNKAITRYASELDKLCSTVRKLVSDCDFDACIPYISAAMERYPHAPHPHNLMGIVLEKKGDHLSAMRHFRASWALDPAYIPANHNLNTYGTFYARGKCAFDESDLPNEAPSKIEIVYDENGIGHVVRR